MDAKKLKILHLKDDISLCEMVSAPYYMREKLFLTSNNNFIYIYRSVGVQKSLKNVPCKNPRGFTWFLKHPFSEKNFLTVKSLKNAVDCRKNYTRRKSRYFLEPISNHANPPGPGVLHMTGGQGNFFSNRIISVKFFICQRRWQIKYLTDIILLEGGSKEVQNIS